MRRSSLSSTDRPISGLDEQDPLSREYKRGYQLRFRRRARLAASSTLAVVAIASLGIMPLAKIGPFRPGPDVIVASPTHSAFSPPTKLIPPLVIHRTPGATATSQPTSCRNSFDPACGAFYWTTDPGANAPTQISVTFSPAQPQVGDMVTFTVTTSDADAPIVDAYIRTTWGDNCGTILIPPLKLDPAAPHGPWTPPERRRGFHQFEFAHTFCKSGTFRINFDAASNSGPPWNRSCAGCDKLDPYRGEVDIWKTITVSPGPTPSPSPTTPTPSPTAT